MKDAAILASKKIWQKTNKDVTRDFSNMYHIGEKT